MLKKHFGEKIVGIDYTTREGVYGICINSNNQVAVVKVNNSYFLPGGGIEKEENHEECLKREFIEETGYNIEVCEYIETLVQYYHSKAKNIHYELIGNFYLVNLTEKIKEKLEEDHELVWKDISEIDRIMELEYQSWVIKKVYNNLK